MSCVFLKLLPSCDLLPELGSLGFAKVTRIFFEKYSLNHSQSLFSPLRFRFRSTCSKKMLRSFAPFPSTCEWVRCVSPFSVMSRSIRGLRGYMHVGDAHTYAGLHTWHTRKVLRSARLYIHSHGDLMQAHARAPTHSHHPPKNKQRSWRNKTSQLHWPLSRVLLLLGLFF